MPDATGAGEVRRTLGLVLGAALLTATLVFPPPPGLSVEAWRTAGVAMLMAVWWITEAAPLSATALAPLALFPLLGVAPFRAAAAPFADPIIFLFLGGFMIGAGMQRWSLHERLGLRLISVTGASPKGLVAGFLISTAFLSMWVSNSATAMMMLPAAGAVLLLVASKSGHGQAETLGVALMLSVAYGASIGGLGTLVGTPPNALLAAYMAREHGVQIGFAQWMAFGLPVSCAMLLAAWVVINRLYPVSADPGGGAAAAIAERRASLGPMSNAEMRVAIIFVLTAGAWILRPFYAPHVPGIDDSVIAMTAALALFITPSGMDEQRRLLQWSDVANIPWDVLLLFGGGLSLAAAISSSGLAAWIAGSLHVLGSFHPIYIVGVATLAMIFLTEITSNTASSAAFLPLGGALAVAIGIDPILLAAPLALAASCAFMLPVATPPNAIVFSSGAVTIMQMARAGLWLNLIGAIVIVGFSYLLAGRLFGS
jgi:solute carrier family 13 (sodium-dependent dicarboxylate transporter), member 2/3/5